MKQIRIAFTGVRALGGVALLCAAGCSSDSLPKAYQLGDLRILALRASAPEIGVGGTSTITPLVSDLDGGSRTVNFVAESCLDPGVALGVTPSCDADPAKSSTSGSIVFTDPTRRTNAAATFNVTPPVSILDGKSAIAQFNGVSYLVVYRLTAGTDSVAAFRRILVSTKAAGDRNQNPAVTGATVDGVALAAVPAAAASVRPVVTAGSAETYTGLDAGGNAVTKTEAVTVSWFLSRGTFQSSRTESDGLLGFTPPTESSTTPSFFVLVVRDDRGGVDFVGVPAL